MSIYRQHCPFCEGRGQAPAWQTGLTHDSICPQCGGSGFADTSMEALTERLAAAEQRATASEATVADAYHLVDEVMHLADRALYSDDPAERMEKAGQLQTLWNLTLQEVLAAAAPATQPDERAAAERAAPTTDLVALVREIAASDPIMYAPEDDGDNFRACRYCLVHQVWDLELPHSADCHWVQARAIVATLDKE